MKKLTTLQQVLKALETFQPAFKDKTKKGYRIKCWETLSEEDFDVLCDLSKTCDDIIEVNNNYMWKLYDRNMEREVFVIRLKQAPSKIIINLKSIKNRSFTSKFNK